MFQHLPGHVLLPRRTPGAHGAYDLGQQAGCGTDGQIFNTYYMDSDGQYFPNKVVRNIFRMFRDLVFEIRSMSFFEHFKIRFLI